MYTLYKYSRGAAVAQRKSAKKKTKSKIRIQVHSVTKKSIGSTFLITSLLPTYLPRYVMQFHGKMYVR
jgi:hypothetical protein